jgi:hypothetical protein
MHIRMVHGNIQADVYGNAYVTIAATEAAEDASAGFLHPPDRYPSVHLKDRRGQISLTYGDMMRDIVHTPLSRRAWVLQETMLSPRMIQFTSNQLYLECRSCIWPDDGRPGHSFNLRPKAFLHRSSPTQPRGEWCRDWHDLVKIYMRCDLTYVTDKLIALAGITAELVRRTVRSPIHGVWRESLAEDLLWRRTPRGTLVPIEGTEVPGWSWAAYTGEIDYAASYVGHQYEDF